MLLFPVRHHSPRTSWVLRHVLDTVRPEVVLVEGPVDATGLVPAITDRETEPPVAVLAFRTDGTPGSSLWPFASYSPEYVALKWYLGDVRAVPDMLQALTENWAGPLPMEALQKTGIAALEPVIALAIARPDLAARQSLQSVVERLACSPQAARILTKRLDELLGTPGNAEKCHALLRLTADSEPLREALARPIVERLTAPADKAEKALVRAAQQAQGKNRLRSSA